MARAHTLTIRLASVTAGLALAASATAPALAAPTTTVDPTSKDTHITQAALRAVQQASPAGARSMRATGALTGCGTIFTHVEGSTVSTLAVANMVAVKVAGTANLGFTPVAITTYSAAAPSGTTFTNIMVAVDASGYLKKVTITRDLTPNGTTKVTSAVLPGRLWGASELYASGPYLVAKQGNIFYRYTVNSTMTSVGGGKRIGGGSWAWIRNIHGAVTVGSGSGAYDVIKTINQGSGQLMDMRLSRSATSAAVQLKAGVLRGMNVFPKIFLGACTGSSATALYGVQNDGELSFYVDGAPTNPAATGIRYVGWRGTGLTNSKFFV